MYSRARTRRRRSIRRRRRRAASRRSPAQLGLGRSIKRAHRRSFGKRRVRPRICSRVDPDAARVQSVRDIPSVLEERNRSLIDEFRGTEMRFPDRENLSLSLSLSRLYETRDFNVKGAENRALLSSTTTATLNHLQEWSLSRKPPEIN